MRDLGYKNAFEQRCFRIVILSAKVYIAGYKGSRKFLKSRKFFSTHFYFLQKVISLQSLLEKSSLKLFESSIFFCKIGCLGNFPIQHASIAQLVEQLICNQLVGGSSPSTGSIQFWSSRFI